MENYLLISDAAKEVGVESHALRYWEGELKMPVKRNEKGHRYYTREDVERFKQIKNMKENGLHLKAIRGVLEESEAEDVTSEITMGIEIKNRDDGGAELQLGNEGNLKPEYDESTKAKSERLQWLLRQLVKEVLQENNRELCREIKESVVKELDYQFRTQEERNDERERQRSIRDEAYYQRMDELLRKKSKRKDWLKKGKI